MTGGEVQRDTELMSLRSKVFFILSGVLVVYWAADYLIQRMVVFPIFLELERREAGRNQDRAVQAIEREIFHLDTLCHDWAAWDDTCDFLESQSNEYTEKNLLFESHANNRVNLILICDVRGDAVWNKTYDLATGKSMTLKRFAGNGIPKTDPLVSYDLRTKNLQTVGRKGVVVTENGPMIVSSRPVLNSDNKGPVRGFLIMGRFLNTETVGTLVEQTKVDFRIIPKSADKSTIGEDRVHMENRDDRILVRSGFPGLEGSTAFLIETRFPMEISGHGRTAMRFALFSSLATGIIIIFVTALLLKKYVIGPIVRLTQHTQRIEKDSDYSQRLSMKTGDEIGALAGGFDKMLEKIAKQTNELAEANENQKREIARRKQAEEALLDAYEELKQLATLDGLTGIANRARFDECLLAEWKRMRREKKPLSLIMCDVDFFKRYNDEYGHRAGDACLRAVSREIRLSLKRPADIAARYGGEEFVAILPNTPLRGAYDLAEDIRKAIEKLRIEHAMSPVSEYVTISMGVATMWPGTTNDSETLIESADKALFDAKKSGRNRTAKCVCHVQNN